MFFREVCIMADHMMFYDYYRNKVQLSFSCNPFSKDPKHVWVICRYKSKWLLTEHPGRGLEFPGGKVEQGESPREAAIREVYEETGASVSTLVYIGQYKVDGRADTIIKNIYYADIRELIDKEYYFETKGPVLLDTLPENLKEDDRFSFMMKDDVLVHSLNYMKKKPSLFR